ncbi:MAG: hypothetical protein OCC45_10250 [Desulfotalea sp.]
MKKLLTVLMIAGLTMSSAALVSANSKVAPVVDTVKQEEAVKPEIFVGLVKSSDKGLMLETTNGTFPLKGLDLKQLVDQEVIIDGVAKIEQEQDVIYVVKAKVKG